MQQARPSSPEGEEDEVELQPVQPLEQEGSRGAAAAGQQQGGGPLPPLPLRQLGGAPRRPGPPSLERHSAPLPGLLGRFSALGTAAPASRLGSPRASEPGGVEAGEGLFTPFALPPPSQLESLVDGGDPAAVAAAAAAAAMAPAAADTEGDEAPAQRSLTRLLGAMYQRQLQRHLERASSRSQRSAPSARLGSLGGSSGASVSASWEGTRHEAQPLQRLSEEQRGGPSRRSSAAAEAEPASQGGRQAGAPLPPQGWDVEGSAVETCPAAVGATWLPALMGQLAGGNGSQGGSSAAAQAPPAASPSGRGAPADASAAVAPPANAIRSAGLEQQGSGPQHRSLSEIRSLFDGAAAERGAT